MPRGYPSAARASIFSRKSGCTRPATCTSELAGRGRPARYSSLPERAQVSHVGQEHRQLHHLPHRRAGRGQGGRQVREHLARLATGSPAPTTRPCASAGTWPEITSSGPGAATAWLYPLPGARPTGCT